MSTQQQQTQSSRKPSAKTGKSGLTLTKTQSLVVQLVLFLGLVYFGLDAWLGTGPEMKSAMGTMCHAPGADWLSYVLVGIVTAFTITILIVTQSKE